jgi:hypothetical protein
MANVELLFQTGWVLVPIVWAYFHYRKIEYKKLKPGSVGDYLLRIWLACLFTGASIITVNHGYPQDNIWTYLKMGGDLIREAGIFWLVFDLSLNLMRPGKAWNYISITNGKFFDKIFKGNWKLQWLAKGLLIAAGELIYYLT